MNAWVLVTLFFEFVVFIISALNYKNLNRANLKTLPYFLGFVFVGELGAFVIAKIYHNNLSYYNVFTALQIIYYLLLIRNQLDSLKAKKVLLVCIIIFIILTSINYTFIQNYYNELDSYTFTLGCFLITIWTTYYFYEILDSDKVENYGLQPMFWIGIGLFVFYLCNIPYMSIFNYLESNYKTIFNAYFNIIHVLGFFMYSFFIIGILCSSKRK